LVCVGDLAGVVLFGPGDLGGLLDGDRVQGRLVGVGLGGFLAFYLPLFADLGQLLLVAVFDKGGLGRGDFVGQAFFVLGLLLRGFLGLLGGLLLLGSGHETRGRVGDGGRGAAFTGEGAPVALLEVFAQLS